MMATHYTYPIVQLKMCQTKYKLNLELNDIQTWKSSVHSPASVFKISLFRRGYTYILQTNYMVSP